VDQARSDKRLKRSAGIPVPLTDDVAWTGASPEETLHLDRLLEELEQLDPRKCRMVELRFFLGFSPDETAALLNTSKRTIDRDLRFVRVWLEERMNPRGLRADEPGAGSLGVLSTLQQAEAIRSFAASHPFVDTTHRAIWGWSGGGPSTLNMMFRNPGLYSTGIANSPGPDQKRYDTIYQERYMGLPSTNAQGYHDGSAINFTNGLTGNLLIIHGSGDDNTHFAGTEALVNRLIAEGKPFDFMVYPGRYPLPRRRRRHPAAQLHSHRPLPGGPYPRRSSIIAGRLLPAKRLCIGQRHLQQAGEGRNDLRISATPISRPWPSSAGCIDCASGMLCELVIITVFEARVISWFQTMN
jgi:predicted esterase